MRCRSKSFGQEDGTVGAHTRGVRPARAADRQVAHGIAEAHARGGARRLFPQLLGGSERATALANPFLEAKLRTGCLHLTTRGGTKYEIDKTFGKGIEDLGLMENIGSPPLISEQVIGWGRL